MKTIKNKWVLFGKYKSTFTAATLESVLKEKNSFVVYENPSPFILKRSSFNRSLKRIFNSTQRRTPWAVLELENLLRISSKGHLNTQKLIGYRYNTGLLKCSIYTLLNYHDEHNDARDFCKENPDKAGYVFRLILESIHNAFNHGVAHLDPWLGNFLISADCKELIIIDFENAAIDKNLCQSRCYGFQFGFLFHYDGWKFIAESEYDKIVESFIISNGILLDKEIFSEVYEHSKKNHVSRRYRKKLASFPEAIK